MNETNAITDFQAFVQEGDYSLMKEHENFLKQAKEHLRSELHELPGKRHEFKKINMVAKFVVKEIRTVNHEGLIEDLFNYVKPELALSLLTLNSKAMVEVDMDGKATPYLLPSSYYVRPYLNKAGKAFLTKTDYLFGGQSTAQLVSEIKDVSLLHKKISQDYEIIKSDLKALFQTSKELQKKKKASTSIGSLSMVANKASWDMKAIYEKLGEEFLISFGQVNMTELDEWIVKGLIPKNILTKNRTVEDLRLDFVVMRLDDEEKMLNMYRRRRTRLSLERYA